MKKHNKTAQFLIIMCTITVGYSGGIGLTQVSDQRMMNTNNQKDNHSKADTPSLKVYYASFASAYYIPMTIARLEKPLFSHYVNCEGDIDIIHALIHKTKKKGRFGEVRVIIDQQEQKRILIDLAGNVKQGEDEYLLSKAQVNALEAFLKEKFREDSTTVAK